MAGGLSGGQKSRSIVPLNASRNGPIGINVRPVPPAPLILDQVNRTLYGIGTGETAHGSTTTPHSVSPSTRSGLSSPSLLASISHVDDRKKKQQTRNLVRSPSQQNPSHALLSPSYALLSPSYGLVSPTCSSSSLLVSPTATTCSSSSPSPSSSRPTTPTSSTTPRSRRASSSAARNTMSGARTSGLIGTEIWANLLGNRVSVESGATEFIIQVSTPRVTWVVTRRYSEFRKLREALLQMLDKRERGCVKSCRIVRNIKGVSFPRRHLFHSGTEVHLAQKRCQDLNLFLQVLLVSLKQCTRKAAQKCSHEECEVVRTIYSFIELPESETCKDCAQTPEYCKNHQSKKKNKEGNSGSKKVEKKRCNSVPSSVFHRSKDDQEIPDSRKPNGKRERNHSANEVFTWSSNDLLVSPNANNEVAISSLESPPATNQQQGSSLSNWNSSGLLLCNESPPAALPKCNAGSGWDSHGLVLCSETSKQNSNSSYPSVRSNSSDLSSWRSSGLLLCAGPASEDSSSDTSPSVTPKSLPRAVSIQHMQPEGGSKPRQLLLPPASTLLSLPMQDGKANEKHAELRQPAEKASSTAMILPPPPSSFLFRQGPSSNVSSSLSSSPALSFNPSSFQSLGETFNDVSDLLKVPDMDDSGPPSSLNWRHPGLTKAQNYTPTAPLFTILEENQDGSFKIVTSA